METRKHPLIVILGPTASGKTKLAVDLAGRINGTIISADSRQIYRGMDIGTGKDLDEYGGVPYELIDIVDPNTPYNVSLYRRDALEALQRIVQSGRQPILCGGTGMYIQSLLRGMPYSDVPINEKLRQELEIVTNAELYTLLHEVKLPDNFEPDTSTRKRTIRALEIGEWYRSNPKGLQRLPGIDALVFGIKTPLEIRRERITLRLMNRMRGGLIDEVRGLMEKGLSAAQLIYFGLEYKYVTEYLIGQLDYPTMVSKLNTEIHRFAKRQMTYFRKMEKDGIPIHWISNENGDELLDQALSILDT